jgi:hypothetical protein
MVEKEASRVIEQWLCEDVAPTFDRVANGQEKLIPVEDVFAGLKSRYHARKISNNGSSAEP